MASAALANPTSAFSPPNNDAITSHSAHGRMTTTYSSASSSNTNSNSNSNLSGSTSIASSYSTKHPGSSSVSVSGSGRSSCYIGSGKSGSNLNSSTINSNSSVCDNSVTSNSHNSPSSVMSFSSKASKTRGGGGGGGGGGASPGDLSKNLMALDLFSPFVPVKSSASSIASSVRRRDVIGRSGGGGVGGGGGKSRSGNMGNNGKNGNNNGTNGGKGEYNQVVKPVPHVPHLAKQQQQQQVRQPQPSKPTVGRSAADVAAAAAAAAGVGTVGATAGVMRPSEMVVCANQQSQWAIPSTLTDSNPQGGEMMMMSMTPQFGSSNNLNNNNNNNNNNHNFVSNNFSSNNNINNNNNNPVIIEGDFTQALVLHSSAKHHRIPVDPSEACGRHGSFGRDPPGEAPSARPFMDNSHSQHVGSAGGGGGGRRFRSIQWVDPKEVIDKDDIDYSVLGHYERLTTGNITAGGNNYYYGSLYHVNPEPPRIRIATISSGYKKANFFVREDLDQRIYFHDLEDAVSYMARRGYARMRKEEEKEWMKLLGKAHQVVKVGPTKKKQRYRKGKLVLIMSKPVVDEPVYRKKRSSSDHSTMASTHTSIGRSIRGGFRSYAEKFLAEQEEEKRLLLTGEAPRLLLTSGPVDPEPGSFLQITNGEDDPTEVDEKSRSTGTGTTVSKKSSNSSSNGSRASRSSEVRMVNYRGGVRYFTPDNLKSDDEDSDEEEESTANDSDASTEDFGSYSSKDESQGSTNSELSSINRPTGVRMASGTGPVKSTLNSRRAPTPFDKDAMSDSSALVPYDGGSSKKSSSGRKGRSKSPPEMDTINDDSETSSRVSYDP